MKQPSSGFFFLRAAALLVIGIILVALLLDLLLLRLNGTPADPGIDFYRGDFALIATMLGNTPGGTEAAFKSLQPKLEDALSLPVSLHRMQEFSGLTEERETLNGGGIITLFDSEDRTLYYQALPDSDLILAIGPVPVPESSGIDPQLITWAYYLLIGLLILLWIRPFYRDLDRLRAAAIQFGENDFSVRVDVTPNARIGPVAQAFNAMAERIEYLVSSHRELTNAVSHELRTPLARFKFSMEILAKTGDEQKKVEYLRDMKQDVEELEGLIDEMLSYAKLSEQNLLLELVDINLKPWLTGLAGAYDDEAVNVTLSFQPQDQTGLRATLNPDLMARAVNNILRNCLRYARSRIDIACKHEGGRVQIQLCDDGNGIPEDKLSAIFEPFSRLETSRDRESGGYGLGLAIAARILQRHHGTISAHNTKPHGACFVLEWPAQPGL